MFIKKVTKQNKNSSKTYTYLHLVESVRTQRGPRQRLVLNLGNINVKPEDYKLLANTIEGMITGEQDMFKAPADIKKIASRAAAKIQRKQQTPQPSSMNKRDIRDVDIRSLEGSRARSVGPEYVCHHFYQKLGFDKLLSKAGVSADMRTVIEAVITGRLVSPGSERHTYNWAQKRSAVFEMTRTPLRYSMKSFYRAGDVLLSLKQPLEAGLRRKERELFSLRETMCFFDLTNTFLEGGAMSNPSALWGKSKERRSDCKLITLGLVVDEQGFAKHSRFYPGNQVEAKTLPEMVRDLDVSCEDGSKNKTVVIDAGIASEENVRWLKDNGFHYIVVKRSKHGFDSEDLQGMHLVREDKGTRVEIQRKEKDGEVYLLTRSSGREQKDRGIRSRQEQAFVQQLEYLRSGLSKKKRMKKYGKVLEKVGRLRQKYPRASRLYDIEVSPDPDAPSPQSANAVDICWHKSAKAEKALGLEGCYVLRSDRGDLSDKEIWEIHNMLNRIESAFRSMKSALGLRPVYHQTEDRSNAHLFISTLAYRILHCIEYTLRQQGDHRSWETVRDDLSTHQRITIEFDEQTKDGFRRRHVRTCTMPEPVHEEIYANLGIDVRPIGRMFWHAERRSDEKI